MEMHIIQEYFRSKGFDNMERLMQAAKFGAPVDVGNEGDLEAALRYGNNYVFDKYQNSLTERLVEDIANGQVVLIHKAEAKNLQRLRISPVPVVEEKLKSRVILHISYGEGGGGGGAKLVHGRSRMAIDPRIPTMPGRSTLGFHQPGRHCLHQARSTVRCSASRMKGELHPSNNRP